MACIMYLYRFLYFILLFVLMILILESFCFGNGRPVAFTVQMGDKSTIITECDQ